MDLQIISGSNVPVRRDIPATPILVCNVLDPSEANCNGVGCPQGAGPKLLDSQRDHSQESTPAYTVPVRVGNIYVRAVVDTAAEVTIISIDIWDMIVPKPKAIGKRALQMAGKDHRAEVLLVGPLPIKVGFLTANEYCYVSALTDDMLLGVDFLDRHQTVVDFAEHTLTIHGSSITMNNVFPAMVSVSSTEDMTIPPRSHVCMSCRASKSVPGLIFVEPGSYTNIMSPRIVCGDSDNIVMSLYNWTDRDVQLEAGTQLGLASNLTSTDILSDTVDYSHASCIPNVRICEPTNAEQDLPVHLHALFEEAQSQLSHAETIALKSLLLEYADVFAQSDFDLGAFDAIKHTIDTGNSAPIKQRMRRTPIHFREAEDGHLDKMIQAGVIRPSVSEWASPPILVRKRDGSVRWCVDYRALNAITRKELYPLPRIEDCVDTLEGNIWFSKLDANSAYWQVQMDESSREKTAFITRRGLFEFVRMPFGLSNAPATFTRVVNLILAGMNWETVLAFLDDICVLGRDFAEHLENLRQVFGRFRRFGLRLKPRKCSLFKKEVEFLGRLVSKGSVRVSPESIRAVVEWPTLKSVKDVQKFIGLTNYHRSFIQGYSEMAEPLLSMLRSKEFQWGPPERRSFQDLKFALTTPPVLGIPTSTDLFILDTDASGFAVAAELSQIQDGVERVIGYGSYTLSKEQRRYCTTRQELLAVVLFTRQFRPYLIGRRFMLRTDHNSLRWLTSFKEPQGQLAR